MNKFMTTSLSSVLLLSAFLMTGCSGGGGDSNDGGSGGTIFDGNSSPAAIDIDNAEAIGTASGEAVQKASAPTGLPGSISASTSSDLDRINEIILSTADILTIPAASDAAAACDGGGSAHISDTPTPTSGSVSVTITYDMCAISFGGDSSIFNGTATLDFEDVNNPEAGFIITYSNFRVTDSSGTITINMTVNCSDPNNCVYSSDFVGSDGTTHRVSDYSISGNASSGYNGNATFLHGTYGEVSITISDITYSSSCGAIPSGGTVNFTSGNPVTSSGSIMFNPDCTVSGTWSNSSGAGSF